ncbi:MAG: TRAP transporter substrate-binding protein DctP [Pseudomonadota bacterium]
MPKLTTALCGLGLALALGTAAHARTELVLTSEVAATHWKTGYMERFAELVEAKTDGEVSVQVFPAAQLYNDRDGVAALGSGAVHMVWPVPVHLETIDPRVGIVTLPFTLTDALMQDQDFAADFVDLVSGYTEPRNIEVLAFLRAADAMFLTRGEAVRTPADIDGTKIRVTGGRILLDVMNSFGASAISMPASEMSTAFSQGVIDGIFTTPTGWSRMVGISADHAALIPGLSLLTYAVAVDKAWLEGLPAAHRDAIVESIREIALTQWSEAIAADAEEIRTMVGEGADYWTASAEETAVWQEMAAEPLAAWIANHQDVHDAYEALRATHGF